MRELGLGIRRGGPADVEFVRAVAAEVFGHLGDYGRILPGWLLHEGVLTHVAEGGIASGPVGFTMLGFYPAPDGAMATGRPVYVADLLAIAVAAKAQGHGAGRQLLGHAIRQAEAAARRLSVRELRLSVADNNERARKLFREHGFQLVAGEHGYYDGGQLALHMSRPLT